MRAKYNTCLGNIAQAVGRLQMPGYRCVNGEKKRAEVTLCAFFCC